MKIEDVFFVNESIGNYNWQYFPKVDIENNTYIAFEFLNHDNLLVIQKEEDDGYYSSNARSFVLSKKEIEDIDKNFYILFIDQTLDDIEKNRINSEKIQIKGDLSVNQKFELLLMVGLIADIYKESSSGGKRKSNILI